MFEMMALPYGMNDLNPYITETTMEYHYGKHYKTYLDNVNKLIKGTPFEEMTLVEIIQATYGKPEYQAIFNNAAQAWNHEFFWKSMAPQGGGKPSGEMLKKIEKDFGSYDKFREDFKAAALGQFGSGWVWLVEDNGKLSIVKTANADTPIARKVKPIINLDVWEHAYYLDYQNRRADFTDAYLDHLINWQNSMQ